MRGRRRARAHTSPPQPLLPQVHTDYEGANAEAVEVAGPAHVRFAARSDGSPRPLWFSLCIQGAAVPAVRCDLVNADRCLGSRQGWNGVRPVFSADGRSWHRLRAGRYVEEDPGSGFFSFTVPIVAPRTRVAYSFPYTLADLDHLLRSLPSRQGLRQGELCRSPENRPVPYLCFGNHSSPAATAWIIVRQHAGESPASFVAEGLVQALCRLDTLTLEALASTAFHIVPIVDVDGVFHGRFGKDQAPVDLNRDWQDHPSRPEIAALVRAIRDSDTRHGVGLVLDIHSPHHGEPACFLFGLPPDADAPRLRRQRHLMRVLVEESPRSIGLSEADLRAAPHPDGSAREYLTRRLSAAVMTLEVSYHLSQSGRWLGPGDYRDLGAALVRTIHRFFAAESGDGYPEQGA